MCEKNHTFFYPAYPSSFCGIFQHTFVASPEILTFLDCNSIGLEMLLDVG